MAHFGKPAQAHSQESTDWLRERLLQPERKRVKVQLLRKDQYGRLVGVPYVRRWVLPDQPLPTEMLRKGMAVVYESGGAEYGPWGLEGLKRIEDGAK
jgi:endonuclease YncB( thermonuclease family)